MAYFDLFHLNVSFTKSWLFDSNIFSAFGQLGQLINIILSVFAKSKLCSTCEYCLVAWIVRKVQSHHTCPCHPPCLALYLKRTAIMQHFFCHLRPYLAAKTNNNRRPCLVAKNWAKVHVFTMLLQPHPWAIALTTRQQNSSCFFCHF